MRLYDYMNLSSDTEEISTFKSLKIDIIKKDDYIDVIDKLSEKYNYIKKSIDMVNNINNDLKKYYKGSYRYGFCLESIKNIDDVVLKKKQIEKMYKKYNNINNEFENIKRKFENDLHKV